MALLQNSLDHMKTIYKNISTLENTTQMMIKEGYAKKVDLLEVEARKANVERSITELEANQKLLYHYLSFLLNEPVTEIELPKNDYPASAVSESDVLANNTDLQKASQGLEIREKMVDLAYAPFLPQVGAFAEASSADNTFLGNFNDHKAYTIGAKLSWNLFNGAIDKNGLEKARIEKLKTTTQVELAKKGIALKYDKIRTEIDSLNAQVKSLEKELELSDQIYKNYEGRYSENLVSMSDVIIKQSQQIEKVLTLQSVKNQRNERIFALEKLSNGVK
jgi:outer membrane protein TolC